MTAPDAEVLQTKNTKRRLDARVGVVVEMELIGDRADTIGVAANSN
jgi:hypothetical protein